ncbi:MAG: proline dehydrogenase family protein, partial [Bacteroidales bacterium]|nr:proline dehydrogenase family protein [Bacteroidales bacterium]
METLQSIRNASGHPSIPFAVFKPTAFTSSEVLEKVSARSKLTAREKEQANAFRERVDVMCRTGFELGVPVLIDAEDSWYQSFIDEVVTSMMEKYNRERAIVFNTLQMYRRDRLDHL